MDDFFAPPSPEMFNEPLKGIVDQVITLNYPGRVRFQGSHWKAELYQPKSRLIIPPGQTVNIVALQGNTLLVIPVTY